MGQNILGTTTQTLTRDALTVGNSYQFQIWTNESDRDSTNGLLITAGNTVTLDSNTSNAVGGVGQFAIGTFTADAINQTFTITGAGPDNWSRMSAFQLRAIPEPSTVALLTISAGALLLGNRHRRMRNQA